MAGEGIKTGPVVRQGQKLQPLLYIGKAGGVLHPHTSALMGIPG